MVFSLRAWGGPAGRPRPPRRGEVSHAVPPDGLRGGLGGGGQDAEAALPPAKNNILYPNLLNNIIQITLPKKNIELPYISSLLFRIKKYQLTLSGK